jgi:hypothetical protein
MSHRSIVGQGGSNEARKLPGEHNFPVIKRTPLPGGKIQPQKDTVEEENISFLMAKIGVSPALLDSNISEAGLEVTMVCHGQDLHAILERGTLEEGESKVKLQQKDLTLIIEGLRSVICQCADAGFAHMDLKSPNIVVCRGQHGSMKVRLIDWDPRFITNIARDVNLLKALESDNVRRPCEVLRCTYCIIMWTLFIGFLRQFPSETGLKLQYLAEQALKSCQINKSIKRILCRSSDEDSQLAKLLLVFANWYLQKDTINDFFKSFNLAETDDAGKAFGVMYDSHSASAIDKSGKRQIYGNFAGCPPPPSQPSSNFYIVPSRLYEQLESLRPGNKEILKQKVEASLDAWHRLRRQKNSDRRSRKKKSTKNEKKKQVQRRVEKSPTKHTRTTDRSYSNASDSSKSNSKSNSKSKSKSKSHRRRSRSHRRRSRSHRR